jgi:hypothetical protein
VENLADGLGVEGNRHFGLRANRKANCKANHKANGEADSGVAANTWCISIPMGTISVPQLSVLLFAEIPR